MVLRTGDDDEIVRLQNFINFFNDNTAFPDDGQTYTPNGAWVDLPDVDDLEYKEEDKPVLPHSITDGYTYLLAKYGDGNDKYSLYFYLGGQTGDLTDIFNYGGGLSHVSLFNTISDGPTVPDGGSTANPSRPRTRGRGLFLAPPGSLNQVAFHAAAPVYRCGFLFAEYSPNQTRTSHIRTRRSTKGVPSM